MHQVDFKSNHIMLPAVETRKKVDFIFIYNKGVGERLKQVTPRSSDCVML